MSKCTPEGLREKAASIGAPVEVAPVAWIVTRSDAIPYPHIERLVDVGQFPAGTKLYPAAAIEALAAPEMAAELVMSANVMDEVRTMLRDRGDIAHAAELAERIRAIRAILERIKA